MLIALAMASLALALRKIKLGGKVHHAFAPPTLEMTFAQP
jgi:hypothetical protein